MLDNPHITESSAASRQRITAIRAQGPTPRGYECQSKERKAWYRMISRCEDSRHHKFIHYGARGIKVCKRWRESYANFLADVGRAPSKRHSIDRINNDGNYEPGNVRWATAGQQARNKRRSICLKCGARGYTAGCPNHYIRARRNP